MQAQQIQTTETQTPQASNIGYHKIKRGALEYGLDGYIYANVMDIIEGIKHNWDALITVVGGEGSGKSTLGSQLCLLADPNFSLKNVVFTPEQFKDAIQTFPKGSAIQWDEAITGADSSLFASNKSVELISLLTQCRRKNFFIVICFPYLYKLNRYYVSRSSGMFYVYAKDYDDRGYCYGYSRKAMLKIYGLIKGSAYYSLNPDMVYTRINLRDFYAVFSQFFPFSYEEYEQKKDEALKNVDTKTKNISSLDAATKLIQCNPLIEKNEALQLFDKNSGYYYKELLKIIKERRKLPLLEKPQQDFIIPK